MHVRNELPLLRSVPGRATRKRASTGQKRKRRTGKTRRNARTQKRKEGQREERERREEGRKVSESSARARAQRIGESIIPRLISRARNNARPLFLSSPSRSFKHPLPLSRTRIYILYTQRRAACCTHKKTLPFGLRARATCTMALILSAARARVAGKNIIRLVNEARARERESERE